MGKEVIPHYIRSYVVQKHVRAPRRFGSRVSSGESDISSPGRWPCKGLMNGLSLTAIGQRIFRL